jgi:NADPH:quinone reductase-like Zn-dependent oxidoreductase
LRAVVIREHGGPEVLSFEERPVPEPGPREARIRVRTVGLNHLDIWVRVGVPGHVFPLPIVPGCDVAGVVDALGPGASGFAVGDDVIVAPGRSCGRCVACRAGDDPVCKSFGIVGESTDGGCQELLVVPDHQMFPKPTELDWAQAAAVPLTFLTAWHMLKRRANVQPGEWVLIHAAGSGVSSAAIQIALLFGARVLTTAGSDEKCSRGIALGAEEAINYRTSDFLTEVRRITGGRGVDVVIDHLGGETFERSLRCLVKGGRYVTCGATAGYELKTDFRLVFFKSLSILGSTMGGSHELATVLSLVSQGRLRPVVDRVYPWEQVAAAHGRLESREAFGKVVLTVSPSP